MGLHCPNEVWICSLAIEFDTLATAIPLDIVRAHKQAVTRILWYAYNLAVTRTTIDGPDLSHSCALRNQLWRHLRRRQSRRRNIGKSRIKEISHRNKQYHVSIRGWHAADVTLDGWAARLDTSVLAFVPLARTNYPIHGRCLD
jgi:hypothetical protein